MGLQISSRGYFSSSHVIRLSLAKLFLCCFFRSTMFFFSFSFYFIYREVLPESITKCYRLMNCTNNKCTRVFFATIGPAVFHWPENHSNS